MIKTFRYGEISNEEIFARENPASGVEGIVAQIIADVINRGDEALFEYCRKFDKAELTSLQVTPEEMDEAYSEVEPEFIEILEKAAANIRAFHEKQKREGFVIEDQDGIILGQKIIPIEKAGLYVPGGTAAYPSTVLMDAIPAKIAGCSEIVMVSPPNSEGRLNPAILAAARVAGVDRIFKVGGSQAIAALAYGTESIPKVDKIVGPGNAFVAEAKKQVFGKVSIDMIAGPSEILVVADCLSDASIVAADMLSQAEHDKMASAVLVTDSETLAAAVSAEIERQIPLLDRAEKARASIDTNGKIIIVHNIDEAIDITNEIAPEHLELSVDNAFELLDGVKNAGSVFLGRSCPEALGDYFAGSNHTLPTSGTARFSSPLSVDDFIKKSQFIYYSEDALKAVAEDVATFARKEGLTGHARSALIRGEAKK
ncbi:MAG: histidinol dehydrogenase [Lachnospiraceae bacterium]|nr:histidinol dehydrogenase [Lachnospiraceae bacterium]